VALQGVESDARLIQEYFSTPTGELRRLLAGNRAQRSKLEVRIRRPIATKRLHRQYESREIPLRDAPADAQDASAREAKPLLHDRGLAERAAVT